jgi:Rab GDP dissociation inhibitor
MYDEAGVATGVRSEGQVAKAKFVVGDPSYFPSKAIPTHRIVRAIAFLSHPIPDTNNAHSVQIILPQKQIGRRSDMYVFCSSYAHNVCANGKWIAFVSTNVETANPEAELAPGLALLGTIDDKFIEVGRSRSRRLMTGSLDALCVPASPPLAAARPPHPLPPAQVTDVYEPTSNGATDKCFISKGYDATTHFETTVLDCLDMYQRITGKPLDLSSKEANVEA